MAPQGPPGNAPMNPIVLDASLLAMKMSDVHFADDRDEVAGPGRTGGIVAFEDIEQFETLSDASCARPHNKALINEMIKTFPTTAMVEAHFARSVCLMVDILKLYNPRSMSLTEWNEFKAQRAVHRQEVELLRVGLKQRNETIIEYAASYCLIYRKKNHKPPKAYLDLRQALVNFADHHVEHQRLHGETVGKLAAAYKFFKTSGAGPPLLNNAANNPNQNRRRSRSPPERLPESKRPRYRAPGSDRRSQERYGSYAKQSSYPRQRSQERSVRSNHNEQHRSDQYPNQLQAKPFVSRENHPKNLRYGPQEGNQQRRRSAERKPSTSGTLPPAERVNNAPTIPSVPVVKGPVPEQPSTEAASPQSVDVVPSPSIISQVVPAVTKATSLPTSSHAVVKEEPIATSVPAANRPVPEQPLPERVSRQSVDVVPPSSTNSEVVPAVAKVTPPSSSHAVVKEEPVQADAVTIKTEPVWDTPIKREPMWSQSETIQRPSDPRHRPPTPPAQRTQPVLLLPPELPNPAVAPATDLPPQVLTSPPVNSPRDQEEEKEEEEIPLVWNWSSTQTEKTPPPPTVSFASVAIQTDSVIEEVNAREEQQEAQVARMGQHIPSSVLARPLSTVDAVVEKERRPPNALVAQVGELWKWLQSWDQEQRSRRGPRPSPESLEEEYGKMIATLEKKAILLWPLINVPADTIEEEEVQDDYQPNTESDEMSNTCWIKHSNGIWWPVLACTTVGDNEPNGLQQVYHFGSHEFRVYETSNGMLEAWNGPNHNMHTRACSPDDPMYGVFQAAVNEATDFITAFKANQLF
ncbi:unnamed protein product [Aphanomyces euteiches]|nr:hypothetical protein Ae201684P_018624 [Aphanomyces euteiches]